MKKSFAFLLLFTLCKLSSHAKEMEWFKGSVVLQTHQVLVGDISVASDHDLILFRSNDQVIVLPAHKLLSVRYYDGQANINRKFISLIEESVVRKKYVLYEVVLQGEVGLLRKEKLLSSPSKSDKDDFKYYIFLEDQLLELKSFRTKVYPVLLEKRGALLSLYIMENNLNPNEAVSAVKIIQYYNQLIRSDETLARN